ncbi:MAG TPA: hypothetical protein VF746_00560 [Longimicrobium sp.]
MIERVPEPSMDRIREHARAQVAKTSLRKVAKSAGVKVGATKKFIEGSVPYERNARLWKRWYLKHLREGVAEAPDDSLPTPEAANALEMLLWPLSGDDRAQAVRQVVTAFRGVFTGLSRTPPGWVLELGGEAPGAGEQG